MKSLILATSMALVFAASADARAADPAPPTLRVESGQVMTSAGGEFVSAQTGAAVQVGERLMLADDSAATLTYANGCERRYEAPGVYPVQGQDSCRPAAAVAGQGFDGKGAAIIAGAGAVAVGVIASQPKDVKPNPVSR